MAANNYFTKLKRNKTWQLLIGDASMFSLENRIFHSISIGTVVVSAIYAVYYYSIGFYVPSISCLLICVFFGCQYYYSRHKGKAFSNTAFGITVIIVFSCNYFYNDGIDGSTDVLIPLYLILALAMFPRRQHAIWLVVILVHILLLHFIEYYYPGFVHNPFKGRAGRFLDRMSAFPIALAIIYVAISYLRRSYATEKMRALEKTRAVEEQNQQILLQKKQLEQSNAEKSKLMSIISHDLRAPLVNIQSYLELLAEAGPAAINRAVIEENLLKTTRHTLQLLSNLLLWSKSQMEGIVAVKANTNLLQVLQSTLELEKTLALKKGIALTYQVNRSIQVTADVDMLQLVLRNLVGNAIKFTPTGGSVAIDAQLLGNQCKITVRDTGRGIGPEEQGRLFSIQTNSTLGTHNEKGVGLGLLLCKEFVERQGGGIGFESTVGAGSNFYVFLPATEALLVPSV